MRRILPLLLLSFGATPAWGAGFFLTDRGAAALARGGANTVAADDLNAAWFNPASVGRGRRGVLAYVDLGVIRQAVRFERRLDPDLADLYPACCDPVENEALPLLDPSLMVGWAPPGERYALALSVYGPYAALPEYPRSGAQRYSLVSMQSVLLHMQVTASYAVSDDLRVGVGLQSRDFGVRQRLTISGFPGFLGAPEDTAWDSLVELDVVDRFNPGAVLGVWGRLAPGWEGGVSWQTPLSVDAEGDLRVEVARHYMFATAYVEGGKVRLRTELPQIARAGIRYAPEGQGWDAELDVVWEGWSVHDASHVSPRERIRFRGVAGVGDYEVQRFTVREDFEDTVSVRLGGAMDGRHVGAEGMTFRLGTFVESGAVPDETLHVQVVDSDKVGFGLGVALPLGDGLTLDLAMARVVLADRDVTTSTRRQVNTLYAEDNPLRTEGRTIVGNGRYESAYDAVAMTLSGAY